MFKRTRIATAAVVALGGALALPAVSQQAPAPERIEVTGSRILSLGADSPSPLQVLSGEDIRASGVVNLQDLLLKNPTMGTPAISRTNSNFSTSSAGVSTIDLRNLGTARTLVLVNGRRWVSGVPGSQAVDLNTIPTDFIDRVEIFTGGASSTYGSDAVAGVVNIILKRNFEGLTLEAQKGQSRYNDDKQDKFSLTMGVNAPNGKGHLMGHFGYSKQGPVYTSDRPWAAVDQASIGAFISGEAADMFSIQRPFLSSFAPQGRFFISPGVNTQSRTFDRAGNLVSWSTNGPAGDGVGATGFNRSEFRSIAIPTERWLIATKGEYALNDNHNVFFEGTYAQTNTKTRLEPFPFDVAADTYANAQIPAEFLINGVMVRNPLVPTSLYNLLTVRNADGARVYGATRRLSEVGNRGATADRSTFRVVAGLKGTVFKGWDYDLWAGYGSTGESQLSNGQVNVANFRNALEAIPGANGTVVCRDANARAEGCVPINIFGFNTITPAALAYVSAPASLVTFANQKLMAGNITGEIGQMPAGPVGLAAGFEHRKEFSRSEFDPLTQTGGNAGNALPPTRGQFDVTEVYAEIKVPLLKNLPAIRSLVFSGAARASEYSTVGSTNSYNAGLEWVASSDLKFRATKALSTRAPNVDELYSPPQQTFPTGIVDPCLNVTNTTAGTAAERCRADAGVRANIAANGSFTLNQADLQGISGFNRGNPLVKQEKGNSITAGLVFTPRAIRGLTVTVDYFDISIDGAIVSTPRQFILQQCYSGDATFCQFVTRRQANVGANSAGSLSFIDSGVSNSGELATKGWDLTAAYSTRVGPGNLTTRLAYTRVIDQYSIPLPGSDKDSIVGEVGAAKDRLGLTLGYKWGPFGVSSQTTYIGKSTLDDQFLLDYGLEPKSIGVGAKTYNDLYFSYDYKKAQFYFGIDNVFDVKPPPIITGLPGNITGTETASDVYDAIGRRFYIGVRMAF
jgi:iron complex outermembrane recepter protein